MEPQFLFRARHSDPQIADPLAGAALAARSWQFKPATPARVKCEEPGGRRTNRDVIRAALRGIYRKSKEGFSRTCRRALR